MRSTLKPLSFGAAFHYSIVVAACLAFGFMLTASCAGLRASSSMAEAGIRGGLNMVAAAVDPAYELAVQGCKDAELIIINSAVDGGDLQVARSDLSTVRVRCKKVVAAFDEIRAWHDAAWSAVADGKIEDAQYELDKIIEAWRTLKERTSP